MYNTGRVQVGKNSNQNLYSHLKGILTMPSVLGTNVLAEVAGAITDFFEKLAGHDGTRWLTEFKRFLRKEPCWVVAELVASSVLRLISGGKQIIILATTGTKTIASATDVFTWGIDSDFKNWGLDVVEPAKPDTPVEVHEMIADGDFKTIFGSLGRNLDELCFTQEQIIVFVQNHKKWLRTDGCSTFFPFKVGNEFFVAYVYLFAGGRPRAYVNRFSSGFVWSGASRPRIVVPQALES